MSDVITIHVLAYGELYQQVLNAVAAFMNMKQGGFLGLLKLTALIGIIMASVGYLKERNPMIYAKWVMGYVLVLQLVIEPKTSVEIYDISAQRAIAVDNVPVVFALTANLMTTVGVGLAESYDALLSLPDDLTYTATGSLFGSKMIQASRDFRIQDPQLKAEMDAYLRNCVVGDIQMNHKYSVNDLSSSLNIWDLISKNASELRLTPVNGQLVSCLAASKSEGDTSLRAKLNAEIKKAYTLFGINLFGKQKETSYEKLFETHLKSSFDYYQHMTDSSADIFLQSMMINAIGDGIKNYSSFTDSTSGVVNQLFSKSQTQHRWSWAVAGQKAAWSLPILHALLTLLLFGLFPVVMVMTTMPNGINIFRGYVQFFLSLQFWPVLFAILNAAMTQYGQGKSLQYGGMSMVNIDKIDELHSDLTGVAGYLMLMIPFLAKGLVSSLSDAFNNLATSMTSHFQGSAMASANDAASASFGLGQTSFYNTNANSFSANKHDSNSTHMHGMRSEQMATGVIKTRTASGDTVFDVSPGMTKSALSINKTDGLNESLNEASEGARQASTNAHQSFQSSIANAAHKALQLSQLKGHDMRFGEGVSKSETGQYQEALSTLNHIATDVSKRTGVSTDEAFTSLAKASANLQFNTSKLASKAVQGLSFGMIDGSATMSAGYNRSSSSSDKAHDSNDSGISAKESQDFTAAFSQVQHFVKNHHFDESDSKGASLSNQMGADLRKAQTYNQQYDAALSRSERISHASSYVKSQGNQLNENLEQAFPAFVEHRVGAAQRDELFSHPGDVKSMQTLEHLGQDFLRKEREAIISRFGVSHQNAQVDGLYQAGSRDVKARANQIEAGFRSEGQEVIAQGERLEIKGELGGAPLQTEVNQKLATYKRNINTQKEQLNKKMDGVSHEASTEIIRGQTNAKRIISPRENDTHDKKDA